MDVLVRDRLLEVNRRFYAAVAEPFDQTRRSWPPGYLRLLALWPQRSEDQPPRIADIGCGNGRWARLLEAERISCTYVGLDSSDRLLALAAEEARRFQHVRAHFRQADLAVHGWSKMLPEQTAGFDLVVCLATLQHLPSCELRAAVVQELTALLAPGGRLALSAWQFLTAPRFADSRLDWASVGLSASEIEPGDALLPWRQGTYAVRYVHQIDETELHELAAAAGLTAVVFFRADGKEGTLNLYALFRAQDDHAEPDEAIR